MCSRRRLQQRFGHALEERAGTGRAGLMIFTRCITALGPRLRRAAQHLVDAVQQRLQVAAEHAVGVQLGQQLVGHQQAVQLALVEPQAGQFVLLAAASAPKR
jgi:hypothetical protein